MIWTMQATVAALRAVCLVPLQPLTQVWNGFGYLCLNLKKIYICVLWPAALVSQLIYLLWTWPCCIFYNVSFKLSTLKNALSLLCEQTKSGIKWSHRQRNVWPGWSLLRKLKVPIQFMLDLYRSHFCQRRILSVHQLFYNQFLPEPTWANFPPDSIYAGNTCVCFRSACVLPVYRGS